MNPDVSTTRPHDASVHRNFIAHETAETHIQMKRAWRRMKFGGLIRNDFDFLFRRAPLTFWLLQIGQGLDVEQRADDGDEEVIEEKCLFDREGLKK